MLGMVTSRVYATYMYTWTFLVQQNVASVVRMGAFCLLASKQLNHLCLLATRCQQWQFDAYGPAYGWRRYMCIWTSGPMGLWAPGAAVQVWDCTSVQCPSIAICSRAWACTVFPVRSTYSRLMSAKKKVGLLVMVSCTTPQLNFVVTAPLNSSRNGGPRATRVHSLQ